jgi:hypothetical protein
LAINRFHCLYIELLLKELFDFSSFNDGPATDPACFQGALFDLPIDCHPAGTKEPGGLADAQEGLVLDEFLIEGLYL